MDIVRVKDSGNTLFESCGTAVGTRIVSNSNKLTLDFVTTPTKFNRARGFLLQYQGKERKREKKITSSLTEQSVTNTQVVTQRLIRE